MTFAIPFFAILIVINIWATRRVKRYCDNFGNRKTLLQIGIWIVPFLGAFIAGNYAQPPRQDIQDGRRRQKASNDYESTRPKAPDTITHEAGEDFDVIANMGAVNGIPLLDWQSLGDWAQATPDDQSSQARITQGRRAWLLHLRDAMGPAAHLYESDDAFILSTLEPVEVNALANYIRHTKRRITQLLKGIAKFPSQTREILLVLDSPDDYYHYVSIYYPEEGEFAFSGGMFIDAGCPHFVTVRAELSSIEPVIAHEMTHLALAHLRLPRWLDEGIAVNAEHQLTGNQPLIYDLRELHERHMRFWNPDSIQEFWSGKSFYRTDDGNLLSYELARIIVEQIAKQWGEFLQFVKLADHQDAGATAAQNTLGLDLGVLASTLLETSTHAGWAPDPAAWETPQPAEQQ